MLSLRSKPTRFPYMSALHKGYGAYRLWGFLFCCLCISFTAGASHFRGGTISYNDLGAGRYEILVKSYWDKSEIGSIVPRFQGSPKFETPMRTVSQTLLPDSSTVEHFQKQLVTWSKPGVYEISWKSCCRSVGANFDNNPIGLFAVVNFSLAAPSSSPILQDLPLLNFQPGNSISFSLQLQDPDGHEQVYELDVPYGLPDSVYQKLQETGFQVSSNGLLTWEKPVEGKWLINIKVREKINGEYTGAYILRDFIISVAACSLPAPQYTVVKRPCSGTYTGVVALNAGGGRAPYQYSLDEGRTFQSTAVFDGLASGDYTGIVVDALGCVSEHVHIRLDETVLPTVTLQLPSTVCFTSAPLALTGGSPASGTYQGAGVQEGYFYPALAGTGTHTLSYTYTDSSGCGVSTSAVIRVAEALLADAGPETLVYYGYEPLSCTTLSARATGGLGPYTYKWSTGATTQDLPVCPTVTTTYGLVVTDSLGCTASSKVTVIVEDVRGDTTTIGNKPNVVVLCLNGRVRKVIERNVAKELERGAVLGACTSASAVGPALTAHASSALARLAAGPVLAPAIQVYPNPVSLHGVLQVSAETAGKLKIELRSLTGSGRKTLFDGTMEAHQVEAFELAAHVKAKGVYLLQVTTSLQVATFKLIVR